MHNCYSIAKKNQLHKKYRYRKSTPNKCRIFVTGRWGKTADEELSWRWQKACANPQRAHFKSSSHHVGRVHDGWLSPRLSEVSHQRDTVGRRKDPKHDENVVQALQRLRECFPSRRGHGGGERIYLCMAEASNPDIEELYRLTHCSKLGSQRISK